tara:strand:- start:1892 stop:3256 length:1365 start_codon:yes stop_codon:yes gene_type:complete
MRNINLIDDGIYNLFWRIALPSSIGTVFQNLYSLVDAIFAGRMISEIALAAIGQTFPIYFIIIALGIGLSIATTSIVANSIGEKRISKASQIFCQSLGLAVFVGIIISIFGIYFGPSILESINNDQETLKLSSNYMNIIYLGSVIILLLMVSNSCLAALGDTKSYRNVLIFSFFLNIILNPILISGTCLGYELFKPLGITGIAIATILSQFIGLLYLLFKISKTEIYNSFKKKYLFPKAESIFELSIQGIPASIGLMMIALGSYILLFFVSSYGNDAIAGFASAGRYEQLLFLPLLGLSTAVTSIVGQNLGANKPNRILETYKKAIKTGILILSAVALFLFFTAELSMRLFTEDEDVIFYGSSYLKIWAFGFPAFPLFFIPNATFQGLKKAIIVMYMAILRFVLTPIIIVFLINNFIKEDYIYMFVGLTTMHWVIGILYYRYSLNKIKNLIKIS